MRYSFSKEQLEFMQKLSIPFSPYDELTENESIVLFDTISNALLYDGFDDKYMPNEKGRMYESIQDVIISADQKAGCR